MSGGAGDCLPHTLVNRPYIFIDEDLFAEVRNYFPRARMVEAWRGWTGEKQVNKGSISDLSSIESPSPRLN